MSDGFFRATALVGHLHLLDVSNEWDTKRIRFEEERDVDTTLRQMRVGYRKVWTVRELDEALSASGTHSGPLNLYVHEALIDVARERWEQMRRDVEKP